jgi:hypothetical protein
MAHIDMQFWENVFCSAVLRAALPPDDVKKIIIATSTMTTNAMPIITDTGSFISSRSTADQYNAKRGFACTGEIRDFAL